LTRERRNFNKKPPRLPKIPFFDVSDFSKLIALGATCYSELKLSELSLFVSEGNLK
jgi:hypothetical protein